MSDNKKRIAIVCGKGTGGQLEAAIKKKLASLSGEPIESAVSVRKAERSGSGEDLLNVTKRKLAQLSDQSSVMSSEQAEAESETQLEYIPNSRVTFEMYDPNTGDYDPCSYLWETCRPDLAKKLLEVCPEAVKIILERDHSGSTRYTIMKIDVGGVLGGKFQTSKFVIHCIYEYGHNNFDLFIWCDIPCDIPIHDWTVQKIVTNMTSANIYWAKIQTSGFWDRLSKSTHNMWYADIDKEVDELGLGYSDVMSDLEVAGYNRAKKLLKQEGLTVVDIDPNVQAGQGEIFIEVKKDGVRYTGSYDYGSQEAEFYDAIHASRNKTAAIQKIAQIWVRNIRNSIEFDDGASNPDSIQSSVTAARIADDDVDTRERYIHDLIGDVESEMIASEFYPGMDRVDWYTTDDAIIILAKFVGGFEEITVPFADLQMDFSKMEEDVKTIMDGIFQSPDVGGTYEQSAEQQDVTSSFNIDGEYEEDEEVTDWEYVKSKTVKEAGEVTDYTMYYSPSAEMYAFVLGERSFTNPSNTAINYVCQTEDAAEEWFAGYNGPEDDDPVYLRDEEDDDLASDWQYVKSKSVEDSDGFMTDYTMYYSPSEDMYAFVFGDNDIYNPENTAMDHTCETEGEAEEWFASYNGFAEDDDDFVDYGDDDGFTDEEMANITGGDRRYCPECGSNNYYDGVCYSCGYGSEDEDVMSSEDADSEVYSCDKTAVNGAFEPGWYFGKEQADQYGDLICQQLSGKTVSKRKDTAEEPGGLIYEANQLGIDMWDLLGALEGLCYQGRAREIDDSTYRLV